MPVGSIPDVSTAGVVVGSENEDTWKPTWTAFHLKVFRAKDHEVVIVKPHWDDHELLVALKESYSRLRGIRKYIGFKSVAHLTLVRADHSFIYPQRLGTSWMSPHKNMRMCYLLGHPEHQKKKYEIISALTKRSDVGVEFVERWKTRRLLSAAGVCAFISCAVMVGLGVKTKDWATASQVGQFLLSMFALLFVAVAWSTNHEF
ncbi:hypothetical protein C8Q79DRAFT_1007238 [Trametes meyenii]|nr:hypothetical protein C8Q79DRAFT_1007238 [Trametes meyenii]